MAEWIIEANDTEEAAEGKFAFIRRVVRCKDCKHWEYDAIFQDGWCRGRQQGNPNWYCADGERRE